MIEVLRFLALLAVLAVLGFSVGYLIFGPAIFDD